MSKPFSRLTAATVAALALAGTPAVAAAAVADQPVPGNPHIPAVVASHPAALQDLRSPDARDGTATAQAGAPLDLRSPDARDTRRGPVAGPVSSPAAVPADGDGIEWLQVGLGAGAALLLASMAAAGRRHTHSTMRPSA